MITPSMKELLRYTKMLCYIMSKNVNIGFKFKECGDEQKI